MDSRRTWAWRAFEVGVAVAAALPSILGASLGAPLAVDDWAFAADSRYRSFAAAFGTQTRSRPLEGTWNWAEFRLLGTHPVAHLLVLAAVNAAAAVLLWRLLRRWLPLRIAVLTTLVWLVLANRGSTHLWNTNSPHVFSLCLMLGALLVASVRPLTTRRFAVALAILVAATFAYEGAVALGTVALVILVWTQAERSVRTRLAVITVAVLGAAAGWTLVTSPKLNNSPTPLKNASHVISIHFGAGVLPGYPRLLAAVVLVVVAWSLAATVLPGFKARTEEHLVLVGLGAIVLGAAPFAAGGFPFGTDGFFDRGNLFADLGTALVYGSMLSMLFRLSWRPVAVALSAAVLVAFAVPGAKDVHDYVRAGKDGRRLLAAIDRLPAPLRTQGPVTFFPLPGYDGVSQFTADYDISAALALRYHTGFPYPRAQMALPETGFVRPEGPTLRLVGRQLVPADPALLPRAHAGAPTRTRP